MRLIHVEQSLGCGNLMPPHKSDSVDEEINPPDAGMNKSHLSVTRPTVK